MQLLKNLPNLFKDIKKIKSFKDFLNFFRKAFGIRQKLNSQSFVGEKPNKNLPYICSTRGANATFNFKNKNYIYYNEKNVDGFRGGGRGATYDRFGKILYADREVITIDREVDQYLANAIKYVKRETRNMNEEQKLKFIYKSNGKKFVVDTQNNHLIDLSSTKGAKSPVLKGYYTADGYPVY